MTSNTKPSRLKDHDQVVKLIRERLKSLDIDADGMEEQLNEIRDNVERVTRLKRKASRSKSEGRETYLAEAERLLESVIDTVTDMLMSKYESRDEMLRDGRRLFEKLDGLLKPPSERKTKRVTPVDTPVDTPVEASINTPADVVADIPSADTPNAKIVTDAADVTPQQASTDVAVAEAVADAVEGDTSRKRVDKLADIRAQLPDLYAKYLKWCNTVLSEEQIHNALYPRDKRFMKLVRAAVKVYREPGRYVKGLRSVPLETALRAVLTRDVEKKNRKRRFLADFFGGRDDVEIDDADEPPLVPSVTAGLSREEIDAAIDRLIGLPSPASPPQRSRLTPPPSRRLLKMTF